MKKVKKLKLSRESVRTLSGSELEGVVGGATALCTWEPTPGCGPGSLGLVNGCCSTAYTKVFTCPTDCYC